MKLAPAVEEFIQYKQALGSPYTTSSRVLKAFLRKTGNIEFGELTPEHASAFLSGHSATVTSAWFHHYGVLGCFFRFATKRGYIQHRVLPASIPDRPPRFIPYIYSTEDMQRLLGVPDSHYSPACPLSPDTMRTLILVLYGTGLRLGEVARLTHEDVDFRKASLTIRETKFGKSRLVPIGKDVVSLLRLYRMRHRPGFGYERPPTLLATKIGMMNPQRSCRPPVPMAEEGSRRTALRYCSVSAEAPRFSTHVCRDSSRNVVSRGKKCSENASFAIHLSWALRIGRNLCIPANDARAASGSQSML